jgi:membrane protein implicated in regulation of membrane protease activity
MEIFRFLRWWWSGISKDAKSAGLFVFFLILLITTVGIYGAKAVLAWALFVLIMTVAFLTVVLVKHFRKQYRRYCEYQEKQKQSMVDRLRGS